ncbi:hypothetical protein XELAEV_18032436mg [Xenopus laevis]|uniref:Fucolectin tachylectin-4 pentraxin-1 domain-containing protein n=1 Tax=Xenopus laevis TaxID=8355 RepID=A0A974HGK3_XENLA|nr:hypothetical protein XELAEV_18032436mg [Xenopus laevis]
MKCIMVLLAYAAVGWTQLCDPRPGAVNLARFGDVQQSSTWEPQYGAETAVDGIKETDMSLSPCTHTGNDHPAWWQLDLKESFEVQSVVIVNRGDCCSERLLGAEIRVGNSLAELNYTVCGTIDDVSEASLRICCNGTEGQYVSVVIPGREEYLTLCEVEVYGKESNTRTEINLARTGEVTQSSTLEPQFGAEAAVDGIIETNSTVHPCTHTNNDNSAWWRLDLKKTYNVGTVVIANREDCCSERLLGAEIRVGSSRDNNNPVCGAITNISQAIITLSCNGMEGRYVSVVIPGREEYLSLCEVEVYGEESEMHGEDPTNGTVNLARSGEVHQSSTYDQQYGAGAAIDGFTDTDILVHPCTHTDYDNPAWWRLDLKKRYKVETVVIVNREDCCSERLLGAKIRVGDSADNNNPVCGAITNISQASITLVCNGMVGRYVSVVISRREEYLTLCEVEVYGAEAEIYEEESKNATVNLARSGEVRQSSTYDQQYGAEAAIDGFTDTDILVHPCSHTDYDNPAWWQLDLKRRYKVETVVIVNREDCCSERLLGAEIHVGDSTDNNNLICGAITNISQATITLYCKGLEGRYVSVVIPGREEYLTLCEVEVYGEESEIYEEDPKNMTGGEEVYGAAAEIHEEDPKNATGGVEVYGAEAEIHEEDPKNTTGGMEVYGAEAEIHEEDPKNMTGGEEVYGAAAEIHEEDPKNATGGVEVYGAEAEIHEEDPKNRTSGVEVYGAAAEIHEEDPKNATEGVEVYGAEAEIHEEDPKNMTGGVENYGTEAEIHEEDPKNATGGVEIYGAEEEIHEEDPKNATGGEEVYGAAAEIHEEDPKNATGGVEVYGAEAEIHEEDPKNTTGRVEVYGAEAEIHEEDPKNMTSGVENYGAEAEIHEEDPKNVTGGEEVYGAAAEIHEEDPKNATGGVEVYGAEAEIHEEDPKNRTSGVEVHGAAAEIHEEDPKNATEGVEVYGAEAEIHEEDPKNATEEVEVSGAEADIHEEDPKNVTEGVEVYGAEAEIHEEDPKNATGGVEVYGAEAEIHEEDPKNVTEELEVYGAEAEIHEEDHKNATVNLARSGEVRQSSTYDQQYGAGAAIDGFTDTDILVHPCTHTDYDNPAWWRLNLKRRYKVETVVIVNREDCCSERLLGAEIRIGDSTDNNNPVCSTITNISQATITLSCNGLEGRYVSVVIPGREEYLTLCEVEVYGEESYKQTAVNLARSGDVKQSSTYESHYNAETAVDSIKETDISIHPCSHTFNDNPAWWRLDLKKIYRIESVVIVNRGDCCSERLFGAEIRVGDSADNNNPVCGTITNIAHSTITLSCNGLDGHFVSVVIPGREEYLTLCEVEVYGEESTDIAAVNLARSGDVRQSSTYEPHYSAETAIDGIIETDISIHPCSHTSSDNPAWWRLDLKKIYKVDSVVIVNRMDCCSERLMGAQIHVGDSADNKNPVCGTIFDISKATITILCNGLEGRYVSVVIPGREEYLTLCEVEVYGRESNNVKAVNLARTGEVTQSSSYESHYSAETAIDGIIETDISIRPCSHTNDDNPAWWRLDLKKVHKVDAVAIVNRMDCCSERLLGAEIRVGNSADNNNPVCGTVTNISQATINLFCYGLEGRFVSVVIPGRAEYLTLCEVEVFGEESSSATAVNLARFGDVRQSSTYEPHYSAETAIDGIIETDISIRACTHTFDDNPAWWRLDLKKIYKIDSVVIVNRMDCCSERLLGAEIHIGDSADNNNPVCDNITDISQATITLYCNGMEGRYVSVVIPGRSEYLTLCEVEVYGEESNNSKAVNLGRFGDVRQSSTYEPHYSAETAIDGIIETDIAIHPCTHTFDDNPSWWRLDLKNIYNVQTVVIVNRMDCCSERLLGAEIRVGNSGDNNNPICATITEVSQATITLSCNGLEGRYVSVVISGRAEYLTLCEVEVYGEKSKNVTVNVAQSGEVRQSSDYEPQYSAETAVDGVIESDISVHPCTHTSDDYGPWWQVDLKNRYKVNTVVMVNRMDCCSERLLGAEIRVGDLTDNNNPVCGTVTDVSQAIITLSCRGLEGQYVSVVIPGRSEYLTLCEVEVYGEEAETLGL